MKTAKACFLILTSYFLLAILFTWPLITQITTHGFGHDEDSGYHLWHNWWFKYSLFDLKQTPLTTDYIFHPQKINLVYDANAFIFSALTLPLQFLTNNVVLSSNLIFLLSFALSGLFTFLLAKHLGLSAFPAFLAGLIFAFNPYTTAQAIDGHTNLTTTWLIPLYALFLLKSLEQSPQPKFSIAAGLAATLQLYNDFTYTAFTIIGTGLIFFYFLFQSIREKHFILIYHYIKTGIIILIVAGVLSLPILNEVFRVSRQGFDVGSPLWVQNVWSADLLTFIRPNDQTTFLPNPWTPNIGTVEGTAFLGYGTIVLLIAYGVGRMIRGPKKTLDGFLAFENLMVLLAFSFFLLMLGPSLHFGNNFQFPVLSLLKDQLIFPLPYILLHKIPFIGETQEPARMFPFFILPAAILVATALQRIVRRLRPIPSRLLLTSYFLLLILEYLTIPFPTLNLSPQPIFETIRNDPENKAVLTLPLGFNSGNYVLGQSPTGSLQFYQVYFQKPSFRATVARLPYANFDYYQKLPLFPYLLDPESPIDFVNLASQKEEIRGIFKDQLHVKYILVFEKKYKKPMGETYRVISEILGARTIYDREGIKAFVI